MSGKLDRRVRSVDQRHRPAGAVDVDADEGRARVGTTWAGCARADAFECTAFSEGFAAATLDLADVIVEVATVAELAFSHAAMARCMRVAAVAVVMAGCDD